jgi:GAF domain-containing protein
VPGVQALVGGFLTPSLLALSLAVSVISAAFLLGPAWAFLIGGIGAGTLLGQAYNDYQGLTVTLMDEELTEATRSLLVITVENVFLLGIVSLIGWLLTRNLFNWARDAQRRAVQLEATMVIGEAASRAPSLNDLLNDVAERVREAFGFYHSQVFLLDQEGRMARLEASTGRAGEALLARGHALPVGSQSVVGQATGLAEPVVVNDTTWSRIHRPNELLPDTRSELALPLLVGDQVIGAIDVQSTHADSFQPDDVRSLQVLAAQLAAAIDKARLVDELQSRANENQRLFEEAQRSLQQIEDLNRRLTREGWSDYLRATRAGSTLGYTLQGENVRTDNDWTAPMKQAYQGESSVVVRQDQSAQIAALPVRVRGEVIGVLEVERDGEHPWTDSELSLAETLVERLALAIENARLFEQATQAAEREQVVNRITQDVQGAASVDEVLQAALAELSAVLGASRGLVQISPKVKQSLPGTGKLTPPIGGV